MPLHLPIAGLTILLLTALASYSGWHATNVARPAYAASQASTFVPGPGFSTAVGTGAAVRNLLF